MPAAGVAATRRRRQRAASAPPAGPEGRPPPPAAAGRIVALLVTDTAGGQRLVPLAEAPVLVGRDAGCGLRLDSPFVSRHHARLEQQPAGTELVDLDSHNGCFLNERRVKRTALLRPGDVIGIADVAIRCLGQPAAAAATQQYDRTALRRQPAPSPTGAPPASPPPASPSPARRRGGVLRVQVRTHEVWLGQQPPARRLSAQEFKLLAYLYEHRDRVCTRQELGDTIWGADNWDLNMLYHLTHRLKDKLESAGSGAAAPRYIQTIPQIGYRLTP